MTWTDDAACRGMDSAIFFPTVGHAADAARAVCAGCPVRAECLTEALATESAPHRFGVRGGMTPRERDTKARRRQIRRVAPCGTEAGYKRHRRNNEDACWPCREANRLASRRRNERRSA